MLRICVTTLKFQNKVYKMKDDGIFEKHILFQCKKSYKKYPLFVER